nr:T-Fas=fas antigen isoform {N-terminal, alternatively spliced, extracellular domain} [mice, liver, 6-week old, BALB/c, Peptide Partial, 27 aa] [Mus sp.]
MLWVHTQGKKKVEDCKMNGGTPTCAPC